MFVLYRRSGRRAGLAAVFSGDDGYTKLGHLQGDMEVDEGRRRLRAATNRGREEP